VSLIQDLAKLTYDPDDRATIWKFLETNTLFHMSVARIGGNRYLNEALERVYALCERLLHAGMALTNRRRDVPTDHKDVVDAVCRGDPSAARAVATKEAEAARNLIIDALLSSASIRGASIEIPRF
jgi:DNA-binding GntR family transcriptional regulator